MRCAGHLALWVAIVLAGAGTGVAGQLPVSSPGVDQDRDGVPDALEQALLERFRPKFVVSVGECDQLPAAFRPGTLDPVATARDGTIYGQAFRRPAATFAGESIELHYYHLWSRDCGRQGHPLDAEHVSVLVNAVSLDEPVLNWRARTWYAAAHESTLCDASRWTTAAEIGAEAGGTTIWISAGKHASFFSAELCHGGCGDDRCEQAAVLASSQVINLGEAGAPLNGARWAASSRWPLPQKMVSDFPDEVLAQLSRVASVQRGGNRPARAVVASGGEALDALSVGNQETAGALATGRSRTSRALRKAATATRKFLFGK